jgi:hypothetical protein
LPNSFACEGVNSVVAATFPNKESFHPHVALSLCTLQGDQGQPVVLVARFDPDEARALGASLALSADHIQTAYDEYLIEAKSDGSISD